MVKCPLVGGWVVGSIPHLYPLSYFSFQPVFHDWCNKGCDMSYLVCGMVHVNEPLPIEKSNPCSGGCEFFLYLNSPLP